MRDSTVHRRTKETDVTVTLELDGTGEADIDTGVGFLNHMLTLFAVHGHFDLTVRATGDLDVDCHHTVEDVALTLGEALRKALGDKVGIHRYGSMLLPMDEALAEVILDISGRSYLAVSYTHLDVYKRQVFKGGNHMYTWSFAYSFDAIKEWLFAQAKGK